MVAAFQEEKVDGVAVLVVLLEYQVTQGLPKAAGQHLLCDSMAGPGDVDLLH
jgi:hypothetical protein